MIMLQRLIRFARDKAGSIMPLTALMLPLILGMTGVGVDVSVWLSSKRNLQTAADAAVIAAAWEIVNDYEDYAEDAALREAEANGFDPDANGQLDLEIDTDSGQTIVTATLSQQSDVYFSGVIYKGDIFTAAAAASAVIDTAGDFCILSLDDEADAAVSAVGTVDIDSAGCGVAVNSDSDTAMDLTGVVNMNVGDISIVGDYEVGSNVDLSYTSMNTGAGKAQDPYADLEIPDFTDCTSRQMRSGPVRVSGTRTLNPGVYCGGLTISGNGTVTMNEGVYYIDGGDFTVTGNGAINAEGVSIVLTNSGGSSYGTYGKLNISGGKAIRITAPEEGEDMEGVAVYQDRNAPASNQCNSMTGNSAVEVVGALYTPSNCLTIGGTRGTGSSNEAICTRIIAKTVKFHGNPSFGNECTGVAVEDIGQVSVRLIL